MAEKPFSLWQKAEWRETGKGSRILVEATAGSHPSSCHSISVKGQISRGLWSTTSYIHM